MLFKPISPFLIIEIKRSVYLRSYTQKRNRDLLTSPPLDDGISLKAIPYIHV